MCLTCRPSNAVYRPKLKELNTNETIIENCIVEHIEPVKTTEKEGVTFTEDGFAQFNRNLIRLIGSKKTNKKRLESTSGSTSGDQNNSNFPQSPLNSTDPIISAGSSQPDENDPTNLTGTGSDGAKKVGNEKAKSRKACKPGIGGFMQRTRTRCVKLNDENNKNEKKIKRKKSKLADIYPQYIQDAFFGNLGLTNENTNMSDVKDELGSVDIKQEVI